MKTIEERAEEYGRGHRCGDYITDFTPDIEMAYEAGATDEHRLLTEWNKPNVPPKPNVHVLIKYEKPIVETKNDIAYAIGYCEFRDYWRFVDEKYHQALDTFGYKFIGWREINE